MRIQQYAYFFVKSTTFTPDEVTAVLELEPTEVHVRGSRSREPVRPAAHSWKLHPRRDGLIDALITELVEVIEPIGAELAQLTSDRATTAGIEVVRSFGDDKGVEEDAGVMPDGLVRLPGQHQLLGFHLDVGLMSRLVALNCSLDFDEYG